MKGEAQDKQPLLLGAVDLGSNSFRVEIGRVEDYRITTESYWKETVRLAGGIDENGAFTPEIQERALAALRRFREKLDGIDPQNIRAVGTQALRVATNSADFLPRAEEALGHPIEIIAGLKKPVLSSRMRSYASSIQRKASGGGHRRSFDGTDHRLRFYRQRVRIVSCGMRKHFSRLFSGRQNHCQRPQAGSTLGTSRV